MAAWPGAEVAGAAADQKRVNLTGIHACLLARFFEGLGREARRMVFIKGMKTAGIALENRGQIGFAEAPGFDSGVAKENPFQQIPRPWAERFHCLGSAEDFEKFRLAEYMGRIRGGEGLQIHQRTR